MILHFGLVKVYLVLLSLRCRLCGAGCCRARSFNDLYNYRVGQLQFTERANDPCQGSVPFEMRGSLPNSSFQPGRSKALRAHLFTKRKEAARES